jgi:hypothetical protein
MKEEDSFLQQHFRYYQEWDHWLGKAEKLKRASLILYNVDLPDLRLYDQAYKKALDEIGEEGKAPVRHPHPDMLPAFSMFGSALENLFKGVMVHKDPGLIGADKLSQSLKSHDLPLLAKEAGITLSEPETRLLAWLSEVVIWKARYSVPTNLKFGDAFFHRLDNISLDDAEACMKVLEELFARTTKMLPAPKKLTEGFDVLVVWKE